MNHSSTKAGSMLGNFLALSPKPPVPRNLASPDTQGGQDRVSFNDTYKGVRQEAADYRTSSKPTPKRPGPSQPEPAVRRAAPSRSEREPQLSRNDQARDHVSDTRHNTRANPRTAQASESREPGAETRHQGEKVESVSAAVDEPKTQVDAVNPSLDKEATDLNTDMSPIQEIIELTDPEKAMLADAAITTAGTWLDDHSSQTDGEDGELAVTTAAAAHIAIDASAVGSELVSVIDAEEQLVSAVVSDNHADSEAVIESQSVLTKPIDSTGLTDLHTAAVLGGQLGTVSPKVNGQTGLPAAASSTAIGDVVAMTTDVDIAKAMTESDLMRNPEKLEAKPVVVGDIGNKLDTLGQDKALAVASQKEGIAKLLANQPEARLLGQSSSGTQTQTAAAVESFARTMETLSPAGRGFVAQSSVATGVGHPQWSQAVGDRVLWLAAQNITSAELRLDPPELGPMQVRVSVNQEQVQVNFSSPHAVVREALDQGATRLREMFNEQGLTVNVDVSDREARERGEGEASKGRRGGAGEVASEENSLSEVAVTHLRLIDHYA